MHMNKARFAKPVAVAAGLFFLSTVPALTRAQSSPTPPAEIPPKTSPPPRATKAQRTTDIFAGLPYTEDQKAKIGKIREDMNSRRDAVIKDDKLNPEQKDAFLQGFDRMERSEIYEVLTPDQKMEVRKRLLALRHDAQKGQKEKKLPQPQR
jgi:Spy/CpxP family protein refolding chaperone